MDINCTIYKTADLIGKRWTILILLEIYKGKNKKKRFSELKKKLPGITSKILSLRLKELEKSGLIDKLKDESEFPIKCEYRLTKSGLGFISIIKEIKKWALTYDIKNPECSETECENCEF